MPEHWIEEWRAQVLGRTLLRAADLDELEAGLRDHLEALKTAGLAEDEAFLIALKRIGETRDADREWLGRLWEQASAVPEARLSGPGWRSDALVAVALAIVAAVGIRVPELFGLHITGEDAAGAFYLRNAGLFVLPLLAAYFAWSRALRPSALAGLAVPFVLALVVMNGYPFAPGSDTGALAALHLLVALWLAVGYAHMAGRWRDHERRLDFVRFSGEWFIHYVLIALGGGVLVVSTVFVFDSIGLDAEDFLATWVLPCGVVGAVVIAGWLADAGLAGARNMAPVLTSLFTPLFTLALLAFLVTVLLTGNLVGVEREVLIGFDLLLVVVLGLFVYAIAARDPQRPPGPFDLLLLVLLLCALAVDALALSAIVSRISAFGWTPNRAAALGLNLVLVVNLGWAAILHARFLARRAGFDAVLRWQTAYLPVYLAWAWLVVLLFPPLFRFS